MSLLNIDQVGVSYTNAQGQTTVALDQVSLQVPPGELLVILGPSGCGKTTLLNLVAGFAHPTSGRVELGGRTVSGPGADRGVIFQHDALLPWLTVIENVAFGLQLQGVPKALRLEHARNVLAEVGLAAFEHHRVWQLSGGMKQRVGLARALAADPRILLMDEPFGALDAFTREQMQELTLHVWQRTGKQIILITHDIEEAVFLATRLVLMTPRPGRIVQQLSLDFGRRHAQGEPARKVKSDPAFIRQREAVLAWFFEQRATASAEEGVTP
ncbi:MAG TPA: taurine ABC transporter ATP-binding subunit [Candidatus Aquabacterium excrementipullorum]|nr:taurine ABC transporter ATP-binding subunit [Candidatus Aquabacterium excrementipullorum]